MKNKLNNKKKAINGQKSKVATLVEECCKIILEPRHRVKNVATLGEERRNIISESRHRVKRVETSEIAVRVATSAEGSRTKGSESRHHFREMSRHHNKAATLQTPIP